MAGRREYYSGGKGRDSWDREPRGRSNDNRRGGGGGKAWQHDRYERSERGERYERNGNERGERYERNDGWARGSNDRGERCEQGDRGGARRGYNNDRGGGGSGEPQSGDNIWMGGLPADITEREIERVCSKFGPVHKVAIKQSERDTFCFVHFGNESHAKDAILELDQCVAFGTGIIKVAPAVNKTSRTDDGGAPTEERRDRSYQQRGGRDHQDGGGPRGQGQNSYNSGAARAQRRSRSPRRSPSVERPSKPSSLPSRVHLSQLPRDMEDTELQEIAAEYGIVQRWELHREGRYKAGWVEYASKAEAEKAVGELDDRSMDEWDMRLQAYMYPGGGA